MVELRLGYSEQERESQKYLALHQLMAQDPGLQPLYTIENKYNLMKSVLEHQGILNVEEFITRPDQLPPPQPNQAQIMQQQMAMKQMELQERVLEVPFVSLPSAAA